ncbi:large ribosomal subunit protein P2 [Stigmatopora nigra]
MRYVAAYLLSALGGNENPDAKHIKKILESVGIEADDTRLEKVLSELKGKKVNDVIASGMGKLASMPAGGAVAVASSAAPSSGGAAAPAPAEDKKKKEEKKEESEESDDDMGFGLFD